MRRLIGLIMIGFLCALMSGCNQSGELEKQAYVLVLGMDRTSDGALELTVRIPKIAGDTSSETSKTTGAGGDYPVFSASGADYAEALEALQWATPRYINLSHIKMVVASEALAREEEFGALVDQVCETPQFYTSARLVVCQDTAKAFINAQQTVIGSRLSEDIETMLNHYAALGYIPEGRLADAYYDGCSVYSDPVAIYADLSEAARQTLAVSIAQPPEDSPTLTPMEQRFGGAALLKNGSMVGRLSLEQTRLLALILGSATGIPVDMDGVCLDLSLRGEVVRRVTFESNQPLLELSLSFNTLSAMPKDALSRSEAALAEAVKALVAKCQALSVDPFGFSESAAGHFATIGEWINYGWRERYARAPVRVNVSIRA